MKWWTLLGVIAGGIVGLGLAAYVVGLRLPAEHVATRAREIGGALNQVSDRLWRVEAQPQWRHKVSRIDVQSRAPGTIRYTEYAGSDAIAFELVQGASGRRFESRITSTDLPFGGRWLISLEPIDDQKTRIVVQEEGVVHSPVFRTLSRYVFGHTATMDAYLDDLARSFAEHDDGA